MKQELRSGKILVVDDVEVVLKLSEILLKRTGSIVIKAKDGQEALKKIQAEKPDIVLLDLFMPQMNGDVVTRFVKQNPETRGTTVILITAKGDESTRRRCVQAGVDYFITKPIRHDELLEIVRNELKKKGCRTHTGEMS
jgi:two-component system alkaline phosphatase synthesis response regulator PhoP